MAVLPADILSASVAAQSPAVLRLEDGSATDYSTERLMLQALRPVAWMAAISAWRGRRRSQLQKCRCAERVATFFAFNAADSVVIRALDDVEQPLADFAKAQRGKLVVPCRSRRTRRWSSAGPAVNVESRCASRVSDALRPPRIWSP